MNAKSTLTAVGALLACGCGNTGEAPLGGPYGGQVRLLDPTDGGYDNVDATFTPPRVSGGNPAGEPGTWTHIYSAYLAKDTIGNCYPCHVEMTDAPASFSWLQDHGYVGDSAPLLTTGQSCLSWYGGNMPPGPPVESAEALNEMALWVNSGARSN